MAKTLLAALLSVALIWWAPSGHVNNSVNKVAVTKPAGQALKSDHPAQAVAPVVETPAPAPTPIPEPVQVLTDKESLMQQAGIAQSDWAATDYIVSHESSWNPTAYNPSGAYGLCQALPASKMASAGEDYMTNPVTQLQWCHQYAKERYNGFWGAFAFWGANRWW